MATDVGRRARISALLLLLSCTTTTASGDGELGEDRDLWGPYHRRRRKTLPPTLTPTSEPTHIPSRAPTMWPTFQPTNGPSFSPTSAPSFKPTVYPTPTPSAPTPFPTVIQWHLAPLGATSCDYSYGPSVTKDTCWEAAFGAMPANREASVDDKKRYPNWVVSPPSGAMGNKRVNSRYAPKGCSIRYTPGPTPYASIQQWDAVWNRHRRGGKNRNYCKVCAGLKSNTGQPTPQPTKKPTKKPTQLSKAPTKAPSKMVAVLNAAGTTSNATLISENHSE